MATMTGTNLIITVDAKDVGHSTSFTADFQHSTVDASSRDSAGWTDPLSSRRSCTMSFEGLVDYADDSDVGKLGFHNFVAQGIIGRQVFVLVFGTAEAGDTIYTMSAYLTSVSTSSPDEDTVTYSGSFVSIGAVVASVNA
jgi:hypothetical protein